MNNYQLSFLTLSVKTVIVHSITYSIMGIFAYNFLNYEQAFASPEMKCWMRQTSESLVMAGPLFQPIRGILFAIAFFPLREILFGKNNGWLIIWLILVVLGILSTFGPAPGSVEGMIYTVLPISIYTYIEVIPQALLLSVILYYWVKNPDKIWINWIMGIFFFLIMIFPILGLLTL